MDQKQTREGDYIAHLQQLRRKATSRPGKRRDDARKPKHPKRREEW